jgi:hypothetical protein
LSAAAAVLKKSVIIAPQPEKICVCVSTFRVDPPRLPARSFLNQPRDET